VFTVVGLPVALAVASDTAKEAVGSDEVTEVDAIVGDDEDALPNIGALVSSTDVVPTVGTLVSTTAEDEGALVVNAEAADGGSVSFSVVVVVKVVVWTKIDGDEVGITGECVATFSTSKNTLDIGPV
jgi:hypothetical protein